MKDVNVERFVEDLKEVCTERNVRLYLPNTTSVKYNATTTVHGFFGGKPITLACARKSPLFVEILVHESCHLDQYFDDYKFFNKGNDSDLIDQWLLGKKIDNVKKHIAITREIELDCEKRSVDKIIEYDLPINIDHYIKKSNAYLWFYTYMSKHRFWPSADQIPYKILSIWSKMPSTFQKSYSDMPTYVETLFDKQYSNQYTRI
jgi:hypothetical protein